MPPEPVPGSVVSFRDLGPDQCRWIFNEPAGLETLFCGQATEEDCSYCAAHFARTINPDSELGKPRHSVRYVGYA